MSFKKTTLMLEKEQARAELVGHFEPVEVFLPSLINTKGKKGARDDIGISKATLDTWMLKMGLELRVVPVGGSQDADIG